MKLYSLTITGFRRHWNTVIHFSDASFLLGENNVGKSSVLMALNYLLSDKKIPEEEFYHIKGEDGNNKRIADKIILTAEFRNLPEEARDWRGFKGRVLPYEVEEGSGETGLRIIYKKTYEPNKDYVVELREFKKEVKPEFRNCQRLSDFIEAGLNEEIIQEFFSDSDRTKNLTAAQKRTIKEIEEIFDYDEENEEWFANPGGIPANVLHRLPKFLLIPAQDKAEELSGTSGTLINTLNELFNDVRDNSVNYREAQRFLDLLAQELDPSDSESEFGRMMNELNGVLGDVFPRAGIHAETKLSEANKVIKPQFSIAMSSNVVTSVNLQGTGMVRSAVFALLRYRKIRENKQNQIEGTIVRPLLIGFEEPEIYLHPNAAQQMRDTIYELASSENNQIVCTTHSPYMIDLSQRPSQTLCNISLDTINIEFAGETLALDTVKSFVFNTSQAFRSLHEDEKSYVKMLLKIDDYMAKVFFVKKVLIVEGDTEDIVLRETIKRMPSIVAKDILFNWQIVKARGKATISSLVKYLKAMGIEPIVVHDEDAGVQNAEMHNRPILEAVGDISRRFMLHNCIENVLGYTAPTKDKPYKAYKHVMDNWPDDWNSVCEPWRTKMEEIFRESFNLVR